MSDPYLTLIGPRGAGKTTLGRALAQRLGACFADLDDAIEQAAGQRIPEIFATGGEKAFRQLEREMFLRLHRSACTVLATGGGAVLHPETRRELALAGRTVLLLADPQLLARRIAGTDRPSLTGGDPAQELVEVLNERLPLYRQAAAHAVDTGVLSPGETLDVLQQLWHALSRHHLR